MLQGEASWASRTTTFVTVYSLVSSSLVNQDVSKPAVSTAAIAGIAVGGTLLFALAAGAIIFLLIAASTINPEPRN
jgi:hypothetical protein